VAALLVLQARGRLTAAELATELEVSVKTARRDLEALAIAGIPVYSQAGKGGGWSLLGGARTDLSGLTAVEARTLFMVAGPSVSVAPELKAALRKLVQALPETFRADAEAAASAVVVDPARWGAKAAPWPPHLEALRRAVIDGVQVRLAYAGRGRTETEQTVHPLGVVQKRLVRALVRVSREVLPMLRDQFGDDLSGARPIEDDGFEVEIAAASAEMLADKLAGWGRDVEVLSPDEVRASLARIGAELVARYGSAPARGTT
jgi:predicted DNA-binding transcriptional regulator YafY